MHGRKVDGRDGWRPRLVALDVDGTVVVAGGSPHARVCDAVRRAVDAGACVVLATGRSTVEIRPLLEELCLPRGFAVCSNGAVTARYPPIEVVDAVTFDARAIVTTILDQVPTARVAIEEPDHGYLVTERFPDGELLGPQREAHIDQLLARPVTRVVVREPGSSVQDFMALVERLQLRGVSYAVGYRAWLDIGPQSVSKGSTLAKVAGRLGLGAEDCLAIGDGRNDVEMLLWAHRGVAMGQSPTEVRRIADDVTAAVEQHGAAMELERWFGPTRGVDR